MESRILFLGPVGAGKTTAVRTMSDIPVVDTDVLASDEVRTMKATTTVAMDLGVMELDGGDRIVLYGALPDPAAHRTIDLRPTLSLVSQVVYFKVVKAGHPVSYGATWKSERDTRVVTIPIGYGDGFSRALSSRGAVLIRGERHPIVGRICMDQFMVDIGDGSAYNEDEVVLIGRQGNASIPVEEVAQLAGTIPYEVLVNLNERIPREYLGGTGH